MFICFRGGFDLGLGGCDVVSWERGFKFFFFFGGGKGLQRCGIDELGRGCNVIV